MPIGATIGSAVIGAGSAIFGGMQKASADAAATAATTKAAADNNALQKQMFDTTQANYKPYQQAGAAALTDLQAKVASGSLDMSKYGYDQLIKDPGYQFRLEQGQQALDAKAAQGGKYFSGDQLKAVAGYNQDMASQEFTNAYNRTNQNNQQMVGTDLNLIGIGANANTGAAGTAANYATAVGANNDNAAKSAATNIINTGNAWADATGGVATAANQGLQNWVTYNRLQANGGY